MSTTIFSCSAKLEHDQATPQDRAQNALQISWERGTDSQHPEGLLWRGQAGASDCLCSLTFTRAKLLGHVSVLASRVVPSRAFVVWGLLLAWLFLIEEPVQNHLRGSCCPQLTWHSLLLLPGRFPSPGPAPEAHRMGLDPSAAPDLLYLQHPMGILPPHSPASNHSNTPLCAVLIHIRKSLLMRSDILMNSLES